MSAQDLPPAKRAAAEEEEEEDDEAPVKKKKMEEVPQRMDCPYLGTINRHVLDFDFEKLCSMTLSGDNVYCDLVDGKFFQGRGKETPAYRHALEKGHYVWMNAVDGKVYCIPDGYEVVDKSLEDIKYNLIPFFDEEEIEFMSTRVRYSKALDGTDYIPGCIGLNNIQDSDYQNVVIQMLCTVIPIRNYFLGYQPPSEKKPDPVLATISQLFRKMYNPRNFKGIVSPHEFYQAVGRVTQKKFYAKQMDPVAFFSWLMGYLHKKSRDKRGDSLVHDVFQGEVQVKLCPAHEESRITESKEKTVFLTLELPDEPLFKDNLDFIPQVPLFNLLEKFNGEKPFEKIAKGGESREIRRYSLRRLPPYVICVVKRFRNNNFFVEKNPTIVTFPLKGLDLRDYIHPDCQPANPETKYDLVANVCHDGKPERGTYKVQVFHQPTSQWFEIHDLRVTPVLPQMVALTESYIQVYQRQDVKPDGSFGKFDAEIPDLLAEAEPGVAAEIEMAPEDLAEAGIIIG
ncbi:Usp39 [Symbiodinium sp. CCMP2592]|nr:Usp39 [Symbiodinium sp. CCMP2592]